MLLSLVHQPSEGSDFSKRLQAKAQNDMRENSVQVLRVTLRPTLQGVAPPSKSFAQILRVWPAIGVFEESQRHELLANSAQVQNIIHEL